jgi:hypothetical protein
MSTNETPAPGAPLQFDRVETGQADQAARSAAPASGVPCQGCGLTIRTTYFSLGNATICGRCRASFEQSIEAAQSWPAFFKACLFGLVACVAGAIVYYGVIAITNLEIGLVAILIGYMVGFAVRKATGGFGGLRYQVLAMALTYFAVSLAYTPLVFKAGTESDQAEMSVTKTTFAAPAVPTEAEATATPATTRTTEQIEMPAERVTLAGFFRALGALAVFLLALPILSVVYSMPSGIISAAIIGFGMRQAWRMTAASNLEVTGPYRVGAATSA